METEVDKIKCGGKAHKFEPLGKQKSGATHPTLLQVTSLYLSIIVTIFITA